MSVPITNVVHRSVSPSRTQIGSFTRWDRATWSLPHARAHTHSIL